MKLILTLLITLGAAVGFGVVALTDPGYVVLARAPYTVRMPLALFVLAVMVAFAGLYVLLGFVGGTLRAPARWRVWRRQRRQTRAQEFTMRGYAGLITGQWRDAEHKLLTELPDNQSPLLNYLGAAYAAQQQGHLRRRDQYLRDARTQYPTQHLAIGLTAARLYIQAGETIAARDALEKLRRDAPRNVPVARLLAEIYRELADWNSLVALLPTLTRLRAFPAAELAQRERLAYTRLLASPALRQGARVAETYRALPAAKRKDAGVVAGYCRHLLATDEHAAAERTLRRALNRNFDPELARLYGTAQTNFTEDQIRLAESWAKKYGAHPELSLALGRLYRRHRQWDKARTQLGEAIAAGHPTACADLAALLEEMGEKDAALHCYRRAMVADDAAGESAGELVVLDGDNGGGGGGEVVMPVVR